jgi:GNAT superfamily N-acetyltransferase
MAIQISNVVPLRQLPEPLLRRLAGMVPSHYLLRGVARDRPVFCLTVVAWDGDRPVGWATAQNVGGAVGLNVFVARSRRQRGIGDRLLLRVALAAEVRWPDAWFTAGARDKAGARLYRGIGLCLRKRTPAERAAFKRFLGRAA